MALSFDDIKITFIYAATVAATLNDHFEGEACSDAVVGVCMVRSFTFHHYRHVV